MAASVESRSSSPGKAGKKRPREDRDEPPQSQDVAPKNEQKKSKKRKRGKKAPEDVEDSSKADGINDSIGKMDGQLLADFFAQKAKRHNKELTAVELNDIYLPEYAFLDTSSWQSKRTLENLPSFLKAHSPKKGSLLSTASESKGSPHTLVVTLAGLRAAEITRTLRQFQTKECAVAKLFAKHIKFNEAKDFVKKTRIGLGIGTPARLFDLIDSGELKLNALKRIVIDGSFIDQKKRGIFDMKELHLPLLQFLNRADLRSRYSSSKDKYTKAIETGKSAGIYLHEGFCREHSTYSRETS